MKRREFFAAAAALLGGAYAAGEGTPPAGDAEAVKRLIADYYDVFYRKRDVEKYRLLLTDDYRLLENGEIFDAAGDIATMPGPRSRYERSDRFDFRQVRVDGSFGYAVYFLDSDLTDEKHGAQKRRWLESAIVRRERGAWRVAILHSTRITATG
jgi:hypothetical protein